MIGQCSILYVNTDGFTDTHTRALRSLGFTVVERNDVPSREELPKYHAVVLRAHDNCSLTSVATNLRAAPRFGRRVLIALVPESVPAQARREAVHSGFDAVVPALCSARDLAAVILSLLRKYPEHRCVLRAHLNRRRPAA